MNIGFHKKSSKSYVPFSLRLEEEIMEGIKNIASKEEISINEAINQSLRLVIENYKKKK